MSKTDDQINFLALLSNFLLTRNPKMWLFLHGNAFYKNKIRQTFCHLIGNAPTDLSWYFKGFLHKILALN